MGRPGVPRARTRHSANANSEIFIFVGNSSGILPLPLPSSSDTMPLFSKSGRVAPRSFRCFFPSFFLFFSSSPFGARGGEGASYWSNFRRDFRRVAVHAAYSGSLSRSPRSSSRKGNCRGNSKVRAIPYEFQSTLVPRLPPPPPPPPASAKIITCARARESEFLESP